MKWFIDSRILQIAGPQEFNVSPAARLVRRIYYGALAQARRATSSEGLRKSKTFNAWWYYSVELSPELVTRGIYPSDFPLLPRMVLRNCDLSGCACLDLGTMEGLIPTLMVRQGARSVLATDASFHCYEKMSLLRKCYDVDFKFEQTGSMDRLGAKLKRYGSFDLINLSGILYHVFSPLHVLAGVRPLLKRNGLMIIATNVTNTQDFSMRFNNAGTLQREGNTFWYPSIPLFEYLLRYLRLVPIDCVYYEHNPEDAPRYTSSADVGYLCVVCRASDEPAFDDGDEWGRRSASGCWEIVHHCDLDLLKRQPESHIDYRRSGTGGSAETIEEGLLERVRASEPIRRAERLEDTNTLRLSDRI